MHMSHQKKRVSVVVSNPCVSDARVIKVAHTARDAGYDVQVFATAGAGAPPWEVKDGLTYHRLEWSPSQMLAERGLLGLLPGVARPFSVFIGKVLTPYFKYRLFREAFLDAIAASRPDLIHAHDLICLPAAFAAARQTSARLVYDAHELEVHRNPPLPLHQKWWVGHVERKFARRADAVNTVGRKVAEVLASHVGRNDIEVVYNAPMQSPSPNSIRGDLHLPADQPLLIYVGKVTTGRGVSEILELLPRLPGVFFATVGPSDGRTRKLLLQRALRLGVANRFRTLPPVPHEQVTAYIAGADLGVISVEPVTLSYRYCMPNKLFELSFANVPILANDLDEIAEFLAENGNGEIADFDNRRGLAYTLFRLINDNARYRLGPEAMARMAAVYSWDAQAAKIRATYARLLQGS